MKDKYLSVNDNSEFRTHFDKWNFFDFEESLEHNTGKALLINPGQIFLFEKYSSDKVYYPILAVFLSYIPCDQTLEIEYSPIKRTSQLRLNQHLESTISIDAQWMIII
jgi:hypothetical protein